MNSLIIVCAGQGERFGAEGNKLLVPMGGHPLIEYTLRNVMQSLFLDEIILVTRRGEEPLFKEIVDRLSPSVPVKFARGGKTRMASVAGGLDALSPQSDIVLIHDGARPGVEGKAIDQMIQLLSRQEGAAIFAVPVVDTIKVTDSRGHVVETPERSRLFRAQTPQGAKTDLFKACMQKIQGRGITVTDDASVCEACGIPVACIPGKESYFKITVPEDKERFLQMIAPAKLPFRVGEGYDIHQKDEARPLVLGGVRISETGGLLGHSDADVLTHAIMDALLGAAGCPDIGYYFPDNDSRYLGISSMILLEKVREVLEEKGYAIGNIDSTVIAEAPKLAPYVPKMREILAKALHISPEQINIKATTNEKLGAVGRGEGIAALASALIYRVKD